MKTKKLTSIVLSGLMLAGSLVSTEARADKLQAEILYKKAAELAQQGKFGEACPIFLESLHQAPDALGTLVAEAHP